MSFTYSGDPSASDLDKCRFMIGDTDKSEPILQDEEIHFIVGQANGDEDRLYYLLFTQAATVFSRAIKRSLGPQSEDPTSRLNFFKSQAMLYKGKINSKGLSLPVYSGPKIFHKGMHSNPPYRGGGRYV